ncbi:MAG: hypothetical protein KatS3mg126_0390 [Lysobacteraceae bacterium]|nr:MAG: hypothetical protein KatS3mg126_0390 [Xanthomonadaceae bacterium]
MGIHPLELRRQGNRPLWVVFWLWGVLASHLLFGLVLAAYRYVATPTFGLMLIGFLAYTVWILTAVWRNASNVRNPVYGQIARFLTVAWALNAVLVSGFLFLGHIGTVDAPLPLPF